ncbi:MAG: nickel pincer cofactor biosynthesis protein LarC [Deltaproteobacteria bacterium]|jgi:uncharacterized protein (TIGR00299 family) protein|nr:nickel pincer cofactor biosynthesis protein LarC [Deltaproteobacteria bacterium]MBW2535095.1 nickel pincer cofactor biosynthesis protein LarC [Deltaproteobacteria bacterium]
MGNPRSDAPGHDPGHHHSSPPPKPTLDRGAGRGCWLFLDCPSGIAGDMTLAALLDLGVPRDAVEEALAALDVDGYELVHGHAHHHGITAATVDVVIAEQGHHERSFATIDAMIEGAALDPTTKRLARAVFARLAEAEAAVHGTTPAEVTFHEVGAVDSIVDIVGAAAAFAYLEAEIIGSPVPLGRGFVTARHGRLPLPAPATVHCLRGVPTQGIAVEAELVTPTGAALLATLATRFETWPAFVPERIGYGAGSRELPDRPNVLRAVLGRPVDATADGAFELLEANVDDLTGELAGHAIAALLAAGALDAWATPIVMKKGRPALTLAALTTADHADMVARALLRETSTIGIRRSVARRIERPRRVETVTTRFGPIPVKVSDGFGVEPQVKPEFDACASAAAQHDVPVRVVLDAALASYRRG